MKWKFKISSNSERFIEKNKIDLKEIKDVVKRVVEYFEGEDLNVDIKKLKGKWKGFYRIRKGKMRIIVRFDFEKLTVFVEETDFRGRVYR